MVNNLIVSIIKVIGSFIFISGFGKEGIVPSIKIMYLLLVVFALKLTAVIMMHRVGKKINSQTLITGVAESKSDLY